MVGYVICCIAYPDVSFAFHLSVCLSVCLSVSVIFYVVSWVLRLHCHCDGCCPPNQILVYWSHLAFRACCLKTVLIYTASGNIFLAFPLMNWYSFFTSSSLFSDVVTFCSTLLVLHLCYVTIMHSVDFLYCCSASFEN